MPTHRPTHRPFLRSRRTAALAGLVTGACLLASCSSAGPETLHGSARTDAVPASSTDAPGPTGASAGYTPGTSGPSAQRPGARIAVVAAASSSEGAPAHVIQALQEAASTIGWSVDTYEGGGTPEGRAAALTTALVSGASGIAIIGFDAQEQGRLLERAAAEGVPVVGWHAASLPGPSPADRLVSNVSTNPAQVAEMAADFAVKDSGATARVVILTDTQYEIAVQKAHLMREQVAGCTTCAVLDYQVVSIASAATDVPAAMPAITALAPSYLLAINGNYFSTSASSSASAPGLKTVAAGDGDADEFQRIRQGEQTATVAEPLQLQGWQLVDDLNRAFAGAPPSDFTPPPALITKANVPSGEVFEPSEDYRATFRSTWGRA